ncbi:PHD finger protein 14 [Anopheles bellator]|uniref:PHD finger protein 14 n=1 Tax=Anopheles bellator TaxID=139047 RepID=UPI0026485043|nr:PHD finger protein 14 [Anopheles bellator]
MRNTGKRNPGITTQALLDFDDHGDSSSDSDFRIEDHDGESDDCSSGSNEDYGKDNDADDDDDDTDDDEDDEDDDVDADLTHLIQNVGRVGNGPHEQPGQKNDHNGTEGLGTEQSASKLPRIDDSGEDVNDEAEDGENATNGGSAGPKAKMVETAALQQFSLLPAAVRNVASEREAAVQKLLEKPICCACLGDRSDDQNEIVECDGCGVTVHEGCYGVSESTSISSTISSCSTEPWFCDACKAGIENPDCELCPNKGGIFKETDVGKWVHLVCALYVPGVAFGDVDQLSSVTLFEMPYNKWGAKTCSLCEDARLARTGVCIGCDAGMCKMYFHVTCAQYVGLLSEAQAEEADQADPFYAHCRIHSDKTLIKQRKRNYNAIKMRSVRRQLAAEQTRQMQKPSPEQLRIDRKLAKHRNRYVQNNETKKPPWVPTQKMPRLLITSATACKKLLLKTEFMGLDMAATEFQEAQMAALSDVRKKWHIPPAFNVEFTGYYLDRSIRLADMKKKLNEQEMINKLLLDKQQMLRIKYDRSVQENQEVLRKNASLKDKIDGLYAHLLALCPNKPLVPVEQVGRPVPPPLPSTMSGVAASPLSLPTAPYGKGHQGVVINTSHPHGCSTPPAARTMTVPTAAALKMGVGFPLQNLMVPGKRDDTGRILSTQCKQNSEDLLNECGICKRCNDQHLLAKCDTCYLHYHLGCLNPPLSRHPKKSKLYGWQCSECDKSDDSNPESIIIPKTPRKSRTRYTKDGIIVPYDLSFGEQQHSGNDGWKKLFKAEALEHSTGVAPGVCTSNKLLLSEVAENPSRGGLLTGESIRQEPGDAYNAIVTGSATESPSAQSGIECSPLTSTKTPGKRGRKKKVLDHATCSGQLSVPEIHQPHPLVLTNSSPEEVKQQEVKPTDRKDSPSNGVFRPSDEDELTLDVMRQQQESTQPTTGLDEVGSSTYVNLMPSVNSNVNEFKPRPSLVPVLLIPRQIVTDDELAVIPGLREPSESTSFSTHHKHSKRRKEKHRNRSPNDDRFISKDHKRKRKRKYHGYREGTDTVGDASYTDPAYVDCRPRIKIKIKSASDGSNTHTTQIYYVRDETVPDDASHLVSTLADSSSQIDSCMRKQPVISPPHRVPFDTSVRLTGVRPRVKRDPNIRGFGNNSITGVACTSGLGSTTCDELICDVCRNQGTSNDIVQCDECHKNYHFGCLEPPLKKTPKRRGYSWHCADCDPTDIDE